MWKTQIFTNAHPCLWIGPAPEEELPFDLDSDNADDDWVEVEQCAIAAAAASPKPGCCKACHIPVTFWGYHSEVWARIDTRVVNFPIILFSIACVSNPVGIRYVFTRSGGAPLRAVRRGVLQPVHLLLDHAAPHGQPRTAAVLSGV